MTEQKPLTAGTGTILAVLPEKGLIRTCPGGCVHVTYGPVTLDFQCGHTFEQFGAHLASQPRSRGQVQLRYYHATLRFSSEEFEELAGMVAAAARELSELDVVRRLLAGPSPA